MPLPRRPYCPRRRCAARPCFRRASAPLPVRQCWKAPLGSKNSSSSCSRRSHPCLLKRLPASGKAPGSKAGGDVRIYTRGLNEVTESVPEIVAAARGFSSRSLVLDGEAIVFDASERPRPFQITMRRFGRKLDIEKLRAELPIRAFFFDCLSLDGRTIADLPTRERFEALARAVPAALLVPRLVTSSEPAARAFYEAALAAGHEGLMAKSLDAAYEAGNRGASWLKIKRAHTLDLIVLAAEWGHGRRTGKLSNL